MKKILSALMFVIYILSVNFCLAKNYDSDRNYVFVTAGGQGVYYLYSPSVEVQEYNPPHY